MMTQQQNNAYFFLQERINYGGQQRYLPARVDYSDNIVAE